MWVDVGTTYGDRMMWGDVWGYVLASISFAPTKVAFCSAEPVKRT